MINIKLLFSALKPKIEIPGVQKIELDIKIDFSGV